MSIRFSLRADVLTAQPLPPSGYGKSDWPTVP